VTRAIVVAILCASCGASAPAAQPASGARGETVARLCEPLPAHALQCVVGWPASVARSRRDLVRSAGDTVWATATGVRAYASCRDHRPDEGVVGRTVVLLLDTSLGTATEIAERLPISVRWTEACVSETDDCASYVAHADGDRLVLTRWEVRDATGTTNVARMACSAVADGAFEAEARLAEDDAILREQAVTETGVTITTRRPGGRGVTEQARRSWLELELDARERARPDDATPPPFDAETADVSDVVALQQLVDARVLLLASDRSTDALHEVARLAERGLAAHPSLTALGALAIESFVEAGDADAAARVLRALGAIVGADEPEVQQLALVVAVARGDRASIEASLAAREPALTDSARARVADVLSHDRAPHDRAWIGHVGATAHALALAARPASISLVSRRGVDVPLVGSAWAIAAVLGVPIADVVFCSEAAVAGGNDGWSTTQDGTTIAALDGCVGYVGVEARLLGALPARGSFAAERVSGFVEHDGVMSGMRGVRSGDVLRVTQVTADLARADLGRAAREVQAPLTQAGTHLFPPPLLTVPLPARRRRAALDVTAPLSGVSCREDAAGVTCSLDGGAEFPSLVTAAFAVFRTGG
jgi:hypothetical protein